MRKHIILGIALGCALLVAGSADRSFAGCAHCGGPGVVQYDAGCPDCVSCGAPCGHCHYCGQGLLAVPVKAVKWVLQALGGGCPCGGCDREVYWGPFCNEPNQCDHCGNFSGGMPMRSYRGTVEGGMPYEAVGAPVRAGCNCNQGSVSRATPMGSRQYVSQPMPDDAYATYPTQPRRAVSATQPANSAGRNIQTSYVADPRYSGAKRTATTTAPRYVATPTRVEGPQLGAPSKFTTLPPGTTADMFQPRLISVTDRVVKPATAGEGALTAQRGEPEIER